VRPETSRLGGKGHSGGKGAGIRLFTNGKLDSASYFQGVTASLRLAGLRKAGAERPHTVDGSPLVMRSACAIRHLHMPMIVRGRPHRRAMTRLSLRREDTSNGHVAASFHRSPLLQHRRSNGYFLQITAVRSLIRLIVYSIKQARAQSRESELLMVNDLLALVPRRLPKRLAKPIQPR
jgi:hypothetical protein